MKRLNRISWLLLAACCIGIIQNYFFLREPCACYPNSNGLFILIIFGQCVATIWQFAMAVLSKWTDKNWTWCLGLTAISFFAIFQMDEPSYKRLNPSIEFIVTGPPLAWQYDNVIAIALDPENYSVHYHDGEECGCDFRGKFHYRGDTLIFDRGLPGMTRNLIKTEYLYLGDYKVSRPIGGYYQFELKEK